MAFFNSPVIDVVIFFVLKVCSPHTYHYRGFASIVKRGRKPNIKQDVCQLTHHGYLLNLNSMSEQMGIKEVQRRVFELTLALYRVTDFFPQGEVLRKNLREKANEAFGLVAEYVYLGGEQDATLILSRVQSVRGYLELARSLRFVKPINITVLEREYDFLADFFERELEVTHPTKAEKTENTTD